MKKDEQILANVYRLLGQDGNKRLIDIIKEKREEFNLSNLQLSKILSIDKSTFDRLIKKIENGETYNIDFYLILKVCQFFKIDLEEVSQLYVASLKPEHIEELEIARKANFIIRHFDLKALKDVGFIDSLTDIRAIEKRIVSFFELNTIFEYKEEIGSVLFSRTKNNSDDKMREFWVRSAYHQFEKINNPNEYDRERLLAIIPKIRPYTRYEEKGFLTVVQALYNIGVTVIIQSYLSKTQVRGGTFVVHDKPCIVITDYGKTYATLWFALLHELYHVIYDLDELKTWRYHLSGEADINLFREEHADFFACEMLLPTEKLNYIKHRISSPTLVNEYAEQNKIHPSIIYSFYCREEQKNGNDQYAFYRKYFGSPEKALKAVKTNPWDKQAIIDEVKRAKAILTTLN